MVRLDAAGMRGEDEAVLELFKSMWARQNALMRRLIKAQNGFLMGVAYLIGVGPVAAGFRLLGRSAIVRLPPDPSASTYWTPCRDRHPGMESAGRRW